ncbi:type 4a pilus biogenesis protein PilO [Paractinoplanes durhamensis]|uniref:Type IV pilus assembly protein PilO n=1 Tax=Paractinoplanes durhamensis TaxID=113563 RepID=A0ABQ3YYG2_9ACTN|nr:type 4a pilus biogenesis protein PilO [Actinoplanes durhamensis]GIE02613.1 hypothetical protein Adu01nite_39630 [Actinoplanes durhamensis]
MGARGNNRLWLLGGVVAVVIIVAATFLLAIKPIYAEKADLQTQVDDQDLQLVELKADLTELKAQAADYDTYKAQLTAKEAALPSKYSIPEYLRALQTSEKAVTVDVSSIGVSVPAKIDGSATVYSVPITLSVSGKIADLSKVINRLQNVQSRAVLLTSVALSGEDYNTMTATIALDAFCRSSTACQISTS